MAKHSSPLIDQVLDIACEFEFPAELQFNEYRDQQRQADVLQVFFRYHPFSEVSEKFAFELAFTDDVQNNPAMADMKRREIARSLRQMETMWKNQFNFIFYRGVPYAKEIEENTYRLKCEMCDQQVEITQDDDIRWKQDLYMVFALKNIDCDCDDGWERPGVDKDLQVDEGDFIPRFTIG